MYFAIVTHNSTWVKNYLDLLNKGATIQSAGGGGGEAVVLVEEILFSSTQFGGALKISNFITFFIYSWSKLCISYKVFIVSEISFWNTPAL